MSTAQIEAENANFKAAYDSGQITRAQYEAAMSYQRARQLTSTQQQVISTPQEQVYYQRTPEGIVVAPTYNTVPAPVSLMPHDPSDPFIPTQQGAYVRKDYDVTEVKETSTGTQYTLTPRVPPVEEAPPGIAERMLDVQTPPVLPSLGIANPQSIFNSPLGSKPAPVRPLSSLAGVVASGESLVYFVPNVLGIKGTPKAPPTVTGGLVGKGVEVGGKALGFNVESNELQQVLLNDRYSGGYAVGTVFGNILTGVAIGKAVNYGVKTYKVVTPKVNAVADKIADSVGWRIYDKGYTVIEPVYQKFTRVTSALNVADDRLAAIYQTNIVTPAKYNIVNPVVSAGQRVKAEAATAASRISDVTLGGVRKVSPEVGNFAKGVVAPNIRQPQKIIAPTMQLYGERFIAPTTTKLKAVTKGVSSAFGKSELILYERNVVAPNLQNYASRLTAKQITIATPKPIREFKAFTQVKGGQARYTASRVQQQNALQVVKKPTVPKLAVSSEVKAVGKVAAGKVRYDLKLKTPADKILKTERTPLKFDAVKVEAKQVTVLAQKTLPKTAKMSKASLMVSGMPKAVSAYPGTVNRFQEIEETVYLSTPKAGLKLDTPTVTRQFLYGSTQPKSTLAVSTKQIPTQQSPSINRLIKNMQQPTVNLKESNTPTLTTSLLPKEITRQTLRQGSRVAQAQASLVKQATIPKMPMFSTGGGFGNFGPKGMRAGKWYIKKHRNKTASEMLKTFGIKTGRRRRKR